MRIPALAVVVVAVVACSGGQGTATDGPADADQGATPLGIPMTPRTPTAREASRIHSADSVLALAPDSLPALLEAAAAREAVWRYREAVELYRRALGRHPGDWRLPLGMGHRLIRLRRLDEARTALEEALALDPEGFNAHYLLALARYLDGDWPGAADVYLDCFRLAGEEGVETPDGDSRTCRDVARDPATRVALKSWAYRALRRAGREEDARALMAGVPEDLELPDLGAELYADSPIPPDDNTHYLLTLGFYRGTLTEDSVLDDPRISEAQWPTVAYAVAVWHLVEGDTARAVQLLDSIAGQPYWARLGHLAAEADLVRLGEHGPTR